MALDTATITDWSPAQLKLAAKQSLMAAALGGQTISINGRTIQRIPVKDALLILEKADELLVDEATESEGGIALVQYGERV